MLRLLVLAAALAAPALPLGPPLLGSRGPSHPAYDAVVLRGWTAAGALVFETAASGSDSDLGCDDSDLNWAVRVLAVRQAGATRAWRLRATGDHGYGEAPITGAVAGERSKGGCATPVAAVEEYDRAAPAGAGALAALGALAAPCDLGKGACRSPDGKHTLSLAFTRGKPGEDGCRPARVALQLDGKPALEERGPDCWRSRTLDARAAFSPDGKQVAVGWTVRVHDQSAASGDTFGRLDVLELR